MPQLAIIALVSWLAGLAAFGGGLLARVENCAESEIKNEVIHGIVAFGGGILVAAVAFVLTPEGMGVLPPGGLAAAFVAGGILFCILDALITRKVGNKAQFMAMVLDFVPEAMALGALFSHSQQTGIFLALFIGAQNLPEGFNAYRESLATGLSSRASLLGLFTVSLLGPLAACGGYLFLSDHRLLTTCLMSAAAGGILYLVFQDIAPQSTARHHWTPPLGAVLGFALGLIGEQLLG